MDIAQLDDEEQKEFLETLGVDEPGLDKVIKATYKLLNLSTFFTVGADECRAWTFKNGMKAPQCAGIIHTDFERGFIKAEIMSYEDLKKEVLLGVHPCVNTATILLAPTDLEKYVLSNNNKLKFKKLCEFKSGK